MRSAELPPYHRGRLPIGAKKSSVYVALGPKLLIRDVRYSVAISESRRDADIAKRVFLARFGLGGPRLHWTRRPRLDNHEW